MQAIFVFTGRTTSSASPKSKALLQIDSHGVEVKLHLDLGHAHVATSCKSVEPFEGPEALSTVARTLLSRRLSRRSRTVSGLFLAAVCMMPSLRRSLSSIGCKFLITNA